MIKFEYRVVDRSYLDESDLDEIGNDGWEMCGIVPNTFRPSDDDESWGRIYFKRPKEETINLKQEIQK